MTGISRKYIRILKETGWFVGLWMAGVMTVTIVGFVIRLALGM